MMNGWSKGGINVAPVFSMIPGSDLLAILPEAIVGDHLGAIPASGFELRAWGIGRHHDRAGRAHVARGDRGRLGVIPR